MGGHAWSSGRINRRHTGARRPTDFSGACGPPAVGTSCGGAGQKAAGVWPRSATPAFVVLQRLGSSETFRLVYRQGRRLAKDALILYVRPNGLGLSRVGVSVARGAGTAVRRNRLRRRVREALRHEEARVAGGFDLVLVPRPPAAGAPFAALRTAVRDLLVQAGVVRANGEESTGRVR